MILKKTFADDLLDGGKMFKHEGTYVKTSN